MYIKIEQVNKKIKHKNILSNINLTFEKGTVNGIVGANGSGKTMLFRAISGLIKLDSGSIRINNKPVIFNEKLPVSVGLIIENPGFSLNDSALDNLKYLANLNNNYDKEYTSYLFSKFGISNNKEQKVKTFSLGMRQKLGIIQALMEHQELVILDEPTNGLDKKSVAQFIDIVRELQEKGTTFLIASHNEYEIKELCDSIIEIEDGTIV
ncbi:ABC transporter ATP-binding protein [Lactococcus lactis]|uniref:ABC transporter ATP-binding protein n=4 Tax=Bacillati TaxID=1783272 RepID=UPI001011A458|nr:ABC transporter ATP-binding protein [Lactococcus lactis]RXS50049.1 ABC transporter ATP-binding protein [Lactococcus lactis]